MITRNFLGRVFLVWVAISLPLAVGNGAEESDPRQTPIVKVVRDTAASVVNIATEKIILLRQNPFWGNYGSDFDTMFDKFSGFHGMTARALKLKSVGSGVIVDKSGLVVTNAHVVNMATNIFVILNDGTQVKGQLVYENKDDELALIKITSPKPLREARLGQTRDLMLGETVVAIGNPLGLENSVTAGIISGKNRKVYSSHGEFISGGLLQTDAPINPGNSGGALFNLDGELIGINVAVVEYSQSIGFAIPVEKVRESMEGYKRNEGSPIKYNKSKMLSQETSTAGGGASSMKTEKWSPSLEMQETKGEYILKLDIAGLNKNKVNVEINENSITVTAERSTKTEEKKSGGYYTVQSFGSFMRTIPMPQNADSQGARTEVKGDTLVIHLPKKNNK
jgi:serine protease Do